MMTHILDGVDNAQAVIAAFLDSLDAPARGLAPGEWGLALEAAGMPLDVGLVIRGRLLRVQAAVLPPGLIDPAQLLYWNRQAPLVCFAQNRAGEVFVCGELPLIAAEPETLDSFLGLLLASATRAREVALAGAPAAKRL
jgi:hypothetical protein